MDEVIKNNSGRSDQAEVLILNPTSDIGGAERSLLEFLSQVPPDQRSRFCIGLPELEGHLATKIDELGYETKAFDFPSNKQPLPHLDTFLRCVFKLRKYTNQMSINTVYSNHLSLGPVLSGLKLVSPSTRTVVHVRDHRGPLGLLYRHVPFQDGVIFNSEFIKNEGTRSSLFKPIFRSKLYVIYNSIDISLIENKSTQSAPEIDSPDSKTIMGMFGRFVRWKNFEFVIKNCCNSYIYDKFDQLLIVGANSGLGNPEYENEIKELVNSLDPENKVQILDFKQNVWAYYAVCDVVLVPSKNEPFGRVPVEAGALSIPVLAANSGGLKEIIKDGETGYLFDLDDDEEFKQYANQLLSDSSLRKELGQAFKNDVETRFDSNRYYNDLQAILCQ